MKRMLLLLIFLAIPLATAISTDMKPVYLPGETMIIEIAGNILSPIRPENVELKRNNVQVPFVYEVKKIGDKYYLYGQLPNAENNYTLHIREIVTTVNGKVDKIDFSQDFSIFGEQISYAIKPGFAIAENDELIFDVFLNKDFPEVISISFPEAHETTLNSGENKIRLSAFDAEEGFRIIQVGIYSVPIFIKPEEEILVIPKTPRFFPSSIESTILIGDERSYPFSITNPSELELSGLVLEFDSTLFKIDPESIEKIGPKQTLDFELTLKKRNEPLDEKILIVSPDFIVELPVLISYTENEEEVETPYLEETTKQKFYCEELEGKVCAVTETCSGEVVSALDTENCCIGECVLEEESRGGSAWIGYLIAAALAGLLIFFGRRYHKTKNQPGESPLRKRMANAQAKLQPQGSVPIVQTNQQAPPAQTKKGFLSKVMFWKK